MSNNTEVIDKDFMIEEEKRILARENEHDNENNPVNLNTRQNIIERAYSNSNTSNNGSKISNNKEEGYKLYVCNVTRMRHHEELYDLFRKFGKIVHCNLVIDPLTKNSRGYGFVTMENKEDAEEAIKNLDGIQVQGRIVNIQHAKVKSSPKPEKGGYRNNSSAPSYNRQHDYSKPADHTHYQYRETGHYTSQNDKRYKNDDYYERSHRRQDYRSPPYYNNHYENRHAANDKYDEHRYRRPEGYREPYTQPSYYSRDENNTRYNDSSRLYQQDSRYPPSTHHDSSRSYNRLPHAPLRNYNEVPSPKYYSKPPVKDLRENYRNRSREPEPYYNKGYQRSPESQQQYRNKYNNVKSADGFEPRNIAYKDPTLKYSNDNTSFGANSNGKNNEPYQSKRANNPRYRPY